MGQSQSAFQASFDVGAATVRQTAQEAIAAPTFGIDLHADGRRSALRLAGATLLANDRRWSAQADLGASVVALTHGALATELGVTASALRYRGAPSASAIGLLARQHLSIGSGGAWMGAGATLLARPGWSTGVAAGEAGGWMQRGRLRASLTLAVQRARLDTPIVITDTVRVKGTVTIVESTVLANAPDPLLAVDATALGEWRSSRAEVTATATGRRAALQSREVLGSIYVVGAWWLVPHAALTASAGTLAADPLRALPGRRVATFGIRIRPIGTTVFPPRGMTRDATTPAVYVVSRDGRARIRVRAPHATRVELRGDCTSWHATTLTQTGDWWELDVQVTSGTQRLTLRIDGGEWQPPANLPSVADDFGERVGLLVVP